MKVFQVGVTWSAEEFAAEAKSLEHPHGAEPTLPRYLRDAVFTCLTNNVQEVEVVRERGWVFWEARGQKLTSFVSEVGCFGKRGRVSWRRASKLCTRPRTRR